ncbi:hypothetical protein DRO59_09290 [Candidatus Bathyarchaeota archaeon]|nr:MAG: hypothetical protein DRO59_09290 [Candidatus Bathyarchaeota archaeon]
MSEKEKVEDAEEEKPFEVKVDTSPLTEELKRLTEEFKALKVHESVQTPNPIRETLDKMLAEYGEKTVADLLEATTSTSGVALATMVASQASLTMQTQVRADRYARIERVPKGAGKTFYVQRLGAPTYDTWTEGSALTAADPTLGSVSGTLAQYGKVTKVTDLLQYTHVLDFVRTVGTLHGNTCQAAINDKLWAAIKGASANIVTLGAAGDGKEAALTWDAIRTAIQKVKSSKFPGDVIVMGPSKFFELMGQNITGVQYYAAFADFAKAGIVPRLFGAEVVLDPLFGDSFDGTDGEIYAAVFSNKISAAWGTDGKRPVTEIFRDPRELSNYVITHITGGAVLVEDASVCLIEHAS